MNPNKIKKRNLDEEILNYFFSTDKKISYDYLDENVVSDIKNGPNATHAYNDTELRYRITQLEANKLGKAEAQSLYILAANTYTRTESDENLDALKNELIVELDKKLSITDAQDQYIAKQSGIITEDLLSRDLANKVNARYENQRPPTGSGSDVSLSDFNMLKLQVSNNAKSIENLELFVNNNTVLKTDTISEELLDSQIRNVINNARLTTEPIEIEDLSQSLLDRINSGGSEGGTEITDQLRAVQDLLSLDSGEVLIGKGFNEDTGEVYHEKSHIFVENAIAITDNSDLEEAKIQALADNMDTIININTELVDGTNEEDHNFRWNKLYEYDSETSQWIENTEATATQFLVGKFIQEFKTDNIYFGCDEYEVIKIVDIDSFVKKAELSTQLDTINNKFNNYVNTDIYNTLSSEVNINTSDIANIKTTLASIQQDIAAIKAQLGVV